MDARGSIDITTLTAWFTEDVENGPVNTPAPTRPFEQLSTDINSSVFLISSDGRRLKLPIPSSSIRDPLNWSVARRSSVMGVMIFFAIIGTFAIQAPGFLHQAVKLDFSPEEMSPFHWEDARTIPTISMGIGAVFWIPVSVALGRRPVLLTAGFMFLIATGWAGLSGGFYSLLAALSSQTFAYGTVLGTMVLVVIDITFIHERPHAVAFWFCVTGALSHALLPILPLALDMIDDWKPFYWALSVVSAISLALTLFVIPETYFLRPPVDFEGKVLVQGGGEKIHVYDTREGLPGASGEADPPQLPQPRGTRSWLRWLNMSGVTGRGWKAGLACVPQMLICLMNPLIFWVALLNAVNFAAFVSLAMTFPTVLASAPYRLPPSTISLINLGAAAGTILAWPASIIVINRVTKRLARISGTRRAEHILPGFILPVLAGASSVILYGSAVEYRWTCYLIYFAYALKAFSFAGISVANTLWITEVFPQFTAAALAAVGGLSYMASFAVSAGIRPWLAAQGYFLVNGTIGVALLLLGFVAVPIAFRGKSIHQIIGGRWGTYEAGALRPQ